MIRWKSWILLVMLILVLGVLEYLYDQGVLSLDPTHSEDVDNFEFELLEGPMAMGLYAPQDFLMPKDVAQILVDTLHAVEDELKNYKFLFPLLEDCIAVPNVFFDQELTEKYKQTALENVSPFQGMVKAGDLIVVRNGLIDNEIGAKLTSFKTKFAESVNDEKNDYLIYLGYLLLTVALFSIYIIFVQFYANNVFQYPRRLSFVLVLIGAYAYLVHMVDSLHFLDLYIVPFCIVPLVVQNFFSSQLALFTHLVVVLLASMLLSSDYQFILVEIIVGMVAIITKLRTRYLSDFFSTILYIASAYAAGFLSLELIHTGSFFPILSEDGNVIQEGVRWHLFGWIGLNVFLTMLSYPLIPLIERLFGLTSEITLVELSDLNNPLLKDLSLKTPGTLQHSLQVANLAEAAASEIGANALLVKVAALYHDIGKMANPTYYIENQQHDNPHDKLNYLESAKMIIAHVTEGVKLAKKHRLPSVLIDFILTHHGTTRVEYFYRMYLKEDPDVDEALFRYPGPKPQTREQAILMVADSLEAASKSLKSPTAQDIDNLADKIIAGKIAQGQFDDTNLTFKELEMIKKVFKKLLKSINHVRIEYPDEAKKKDEKSDEN